MAGEQFNTDAWRDAVGEYRQESQRRESGRQHSYHEDRFPVSLPDSAYAEYSGGLPEVPKWRIQSAADFVADFVAPEYVIDGVIRRGMVYTLTVPTGSGKTAVMLYSAIAIADGAPACTREVEVGDVLFMAGENPDDVRARLIATMEFYKIDPSQCRVHFIAGTFSIRQDMDLLREAASNLPDLILVIIDTFAAYFDGEDENDNAQALDFARLMRKVPTFPSKPAVVVPAHPVKNAGRQNLTPKAGRNRPPAAAGLLKPAAGGRVSNMEDFKFRAARLCTPHENLCAAIGLIQTQILANETRLNPEVMFGLSHFKNSALEMAVSLLVAMTGEAEELPWDDEDNVPATAAGRASYAAGVLEVEAP